MSDDDECLRRALIERRNALVNAKFTVGLSASEVAELADIRRQLDVLDMERIGFQHLRAVLPWR